MLEDEKVTSYSPYSPDLPGPWLPHWIMPAQTKPEPESEPEHEDNIYKPEDGHGNEERNKIVDNESAGLYDLMPDLIWLIAEKCVSFVDYVHFLSINIRVWNDVRIMRENNFQPCLIYRDKVKQQYHIIDGSLDRKLTIKIPKALKVKKIKCSREGWLVAYNLSSCALFNPFTSQLVIAEDPNTKKTNCGISNFTIIGKPSPSSPQNCSVLAMSLINSTRSYMVKSGGGSEPGKAEWWRLVLKRKKFTPCCVSPVLLGEDFYHLACDNGRLGRLRILDLKQGKFEWEEIEELESPCSHFTRNYLTECGGDLVSVFIGDELGVSWVRVFKINGSKTEWQEIDSLTGYSLYVGRPSCMSCVAETVEISDRIYFPKFYKRGLVYYSLKSKKFYSIGNNRDEVTRFHPTTMFSDCAWINPNLSN